MGGLPRSFQRRVHSGYKALSRRLLTARGAVELSCAVQVPLAFTSRVGGQGQGSMQSYSMAEAGRIITSASPGTGAASSSCTSSGMEEEKPWMYISSVSRPMGSMKSWCRGLSLNRTIFVSMDGQYRGPTPSMTPE